MELYLSDEVWVKLTSLVNDFFKILLDGQIKLASFLLHKMQQWLYFLTSEVEPRIQVVNHSVFKNTHVQNIENKDACMKSFTCQSYRRILQVEKKSGKQAILLALFNNDADGCFTWHALLRDLSVIDFFLQGEITDKAINEAGFPLAISIHPTHCLGIMTWVPGGIKHHHTVSSNEVHPQATRSKKIIKQTRVETGWRHVHQGISGKKERRGLYLVERRKTQAALFSGSLNWLISRSLSEADVLPSSPEDKCVIVSLTETYNTLDHLQ